MIASVAERTIEAEAAMAQPIERWNVGAAAAAEAEQSVEMSIADLRAERQKRTGRRTCD